MQQQDRFQTIAQATGGELYIGVVGPVRTGKSTFIRRFMEEMVLPGMQDKDDAGRIRDALPQSGSGRTIMTSQLQFVPEDAAVLDLGDSTHCRVRLVDCVGYLVPDALGAFEEDMPRMVRTPWQEEEMPFEKAAEEGTQRVIAEHSTLGIVVTTDGTPTALPREQLEAPERRVIAELHAQGKPFAIVVNSLTPEGEAAQALAANLRQTYDVPALALNLDRATAQDFGTLLQELLYEFPLRELSLQVPSWMQALPREHGLWKIYRDCVGKSGTTLRRLRDYSQAAEALRQLPETESLELLELDPVSGRIRVRLNLKESLYYGILSDACGVEIHDQAQLMAMMRELVHAKKEYDRIAGALESVRSTGYGVVAPSMEELTLEAPEMVRQGTQFGVRLRASAPSWHILRVDVKAEVSPAVGTEKQSEKLAASLLDAFKTDPDSIWETEIFGRSLADLVRDGLSGKLRAMKEETQTRMRSALSRIVGDEGGGLMVMWL